MDGRVYVAFPAVGAVTSMGLGVALGMLGGALLLNWVSEEGAAPGA